MSSNTSRLRLLKARTDHDLLTLINHELDRGFALVESVTSRNSPLFSQATALHDEARALLARIALLSDDDRFPIEARLRDLRHRLNNVRLYANARPYPSAVAS